MPSKFVDLTASQPSDSRLGHPLLKPQLVQVEEPCPRLDLEVAQRVLHAPLQLAAPKPRVSIKQPKDAQPAAVFERSAATRRALQHSGAACLAADGVQGRRRSREDGNPWAWSVAAAANGGAWVQASTNALPKQALQAITAHAAQVVCGPAAARAPSRAPLAGAASAARQMKGRAALL